MFSVSSSDKNTDNYRCYVGAIITDQSLFRDGSPLKTLLCTGVMKSNLMSFKACNSIGSNLPSILL